MPAGILPRTSSVALVDYNKIKEIRFELAERFFVFISSELLIKRKVYKTPTPCPIRAIYG